MAATLVPLEQCYHGEIFSPTSWCGACSGNNMHDDASVHIFKFKKDFSRLEQRPGTYLNDSFSWELTGIFNQAVVWNLSSLECSPHPGWLALSRSTIQFKATERFKPSPFPAQLPLQLVCPQDSQALFLLFQAASPFSLRTLTQDWLAPSASAPAIRASQIVIPAISGVQ